MLCSEISQYYAERPDGEEGLGQLPMHVVTLHTIVLAELRDYRRATLAKLSGRLSKERHKFKAADAQELRHALAAIIRMPTGSHFGHQIMQVSR